MHHGMHFSNKLAEYASSKMVNANGMNHTWSCKDVEGAFTSLGLKLPENRPGEMLLMQQICCILICAASEV